MNKQLINPSSIAIVGASNSLSKPGGGLVHNLLHSGYTGNIYPVNLKEKCIQGLKAYNKLEDLPATDMAILALPAHLCVTSLEYLANNNTTKAFIIISAGFSEIGNEGIKLEQALKTLANKLDLAIIGPNCIGIMNTNYKAVFVSPPPPIVKKGVDFVSASGALAVFLFETAALHGLKFGNVITVGNSTCIGVEEVLAYWDSSYNPQNSSSVKMVYVEQIRKPKLFFKHIHSLRQKGCYVIVAKPGESEAGARAALSHTGSLAGDSETYKMLIEKAGAIQCFSREELIHVACILNQNKLKGKNLAIITHAGGPAVMLTDQLQKAGILVPELDSNTQKRLIELLHPGSSTSNPIDMLATANKEQLSASIDICSKLNYINGIVVIYGKTGMENLFQTYNRLAKAIKKSPIPVYTIMPSINSGKEEIQKYIEHGQATFFDEVVFANALNKVIHAPEANNKELFIPPIKKNNIKTIALKEEETLECLKWAGINYTQTEFVYSESDIELCSKLNFPVVAKVLGIVHKTEVGGVILNINSKEGLVQAYQKLASIPQSKGMLVQEMISGNELYLGAKRHEGIGYSIHAGAGGIFVELINDVSSCLAPITIEEAHSMLDNLKSKKLFQSYRNMPNVSADAFANLIHRFSTIFRQYPNLCEIDLNPLMAKGDNIIAVDSRIFTLSEHYSLKETLENRDKYR